MGRKYFNIIALICCLLSCIQPAQADPLTISLVATALWVNYAPIIVGATIALASAAIAIPTSVVSAQQQQAQADYMSEVNSKNATAARQAAQAKIENQRIQSKFLQGKQLAQLGGMGVTADSATMLDLLGQTAGQERYDELVTEYQGNNQAIQFQNQANLNNYQGQMAQWNLGLNIASDTVKSISTGFTAGASAGSLLTGAGSTAITGSTSSQIFAAGLTKSTISTGTAGYLGNLGGLA